MDANAAVRDRAHRNALPQNTRRGGFTKIERLMIPGPAGELEALLEFDPEATPRMTAVVCHPHPLFGGAMHNKVVFRAARAARAVGFPALRFNFRGVGKSRGTHARGVGERGDVVAALDYLSTRFADLPACVLGFSFGAWVGLRVGSEDLRVKALVGLGFPTNDLDFSYLRGVAKPKLIVQASRDQYSRREDVQAIFAELAEPKQIHWVEGVDHFFTGKLEEVESAVRAYLAGIRDAEIRKSD